MIRHGANKAEIEGFFSVEKNQSLVQLLEENGIELADELKIDYSPRNLSKWAQR